MDVRRNSILCSAYPKFMGSHRPPGGAPADLTCPLHPPPGGRPAAHYSGILLLLCLGLLMILCLPGPATHTGTPVQCSRPWHTCCSIAHAEHRHSAGWCVVVQLLIGSMHR